MSSLIESEKFKDGILHYDPTKPLPTEEEFLDILFAAAEYKRSYKESIKEEHKYQQQKIDEKVKEMLGK